MIPGIGTTTTSCHFDKKMTIMMLFLTDVTLKSFCLLIFNVVPSDKRGMMLPEKLLLPCMKMWSLFPLKFIFQPRTLHKMDIQDRAVSALTTVRS
jgi:hypothetical protein